MGPVLPEIRSATTSPDGVRLELVVPSGLRYFSGHFPGCPVLPGVVQLHWAMTLAARYFGASAAVGRITGLKFSRIVQPGEHVALLLERGDSAFSFRFESGGAACSSGRIHCAQ